MELRAERLRCIKDRVKGNLGVDLDKFDNENEAMEMDLKATESKIAITVEAPSDKDIDMVEGEAESNPPPPVENGDDAMTVPEPPEQSMYSVKIISTCF